MAGERAENSRKHQAVSPKANQEQHRQKKENDFQILAFVGHGPPEANGREKINRGAGDGLEFISVEFSSDEKEDE